MANLHSIDCQAEYLERALLMAIQAAKRQMNNNKNINIAMKQLWDQDIKIYNNALLTIKPITEQTNTKR